MQGRYYLKHGMGRYYNSESNRIIDVIKALNYNNMWKEATVVDRKTGKEYTTEELKEILNNAKGV